MKLLIVNGSPRAPRSNSRRYAELVPGPLEGGGPLCGPDCKESRRAGGGCGGLHRPAAGLPPLCRRPSRPSPALFGVPGGGRAGAQAAHQRADQLRLSGATPERCRGGHGAPFLSGERLSLRRMPQNRRRGGHPGHPLRLPGQAEHQALARAVAAGRSAELAVTMPLSPRSFVRASTRYWTQMGAANGCTPEQMASMDIEPQP